MKRSKLELVLILNIFRYHYFLQLKSDVMEGRLRCSYNEAVILAGYRLQGMTNLMKWYYKQILTKYFFSRVRRPRSRTPYPAVLEGVCACAQGS